MSLGAITLAALGDRLAERTPAPGGGAAAAAAAALGCAAGAMAARYTSGAKYQAVEVEAAALAARLDADRARVLALADADAAAFAALQAAKADPVAKAQAESAARAIPAELRQRCVQAVIALRAFRPRCNPWLVSDVDVAIHLLVGAGRAAHATWLVNRPPEPELAAAAAELAILAEAACAG